MTIEEAKAEIKTSIDELYENGKRHAIFVRNNGELVIEGLRMALEILNQVEPKSKTGKWIDIGGIFRYGCRFCHHAQERKSNFCPHCGADMREGEQSETD